MPAHATTKDGTGWLLKSAAFLTLGFSILELVAGVWGRSLALVADGFHNFSDALALFISWFTFSLQSRRATESKTYGYHRAAVLLAFAGALVLLIVVGLLLYESYLRIVSPELPGTTWMIVFGAAGLALNVVVPHMVRRSGSPVAKPRRVLVHMAGDALAAGGILAAALLIRVTGQPLFDPFLAALIAVLIVWTTWDIVAESLDILLEGSPRGLDLQQVVAAIRRVPRVDDVHDLHVWSLGRHALALSCHVRTPVLSLTEGEKVLREVNEALMCDFGIAHTTIQLEHDPCEAENGCVMPLGPSHHHSH